MNKSCFKCGENKPLDDFYCHPQMLDGHLNKCKYCTKMDARARENILRHNPDWSEREKTRSREKYHRLGYRETYKSNSNKRPDLVNISRKRYPEKYKANLASQRLPKYNRGNQLHHWSYQEEHWKDVIELSVADHARLHRHIIYDSVTFMYRRKDTQELLNTKEKHIKFYRSIPFDNILNNVSNFTSSHQK